MDGGRQQNQINKPPEQQVDLSSDSFINKKMVAQGLMDFAFLSANASQLRYVLVTNEADSYRMANLVMITLSITFQV